MYRVIENESLELFVQQLNRALNEGYEENENEPRTRIEVEGRMQWYQVLRRTQPKARTIIDPIGIR